MSNKLRVGLVLDDTLDSQDGVQQMVILLGSWLAKQGHSVHYLVGQTVRDDIDNIHSLSATRKLSFNGNTVRVPLPAKTREIRRLLSKLKLDVLHVQMPYSPMLGGKVVAAATNETIVGTFHILPYGRAAKHGTRLLANIQVRTLRKFAASSATSQPAAEFARSHYHIQPQVIPNPVDLSRFRVDVSSDGDKTVNMVFLGRLVERKGVLQLLQAISQLSNDTKSRLSVIIGGDGIQRNELRTFTAEHDLDTIVAFAGRVAEPDKPSFLAQADIAVFPSLSGESFGIVLIEAMAAGAGVVVGGDNPGYRSVLSDWSECLVNPRSIGDLSQQLATLIGNAKLRDKIHAQQQKSVEQYDINSVGKQFESLYTQAILDSDNKLA